MRKIIISVSLLLAFCFFANAQGWMEDVLVRQQIIDSLKQELKTAKEDKRIDCLNNLSEIYDWLWDYNDKQFDSAGFYNDQAYDLANKSNYKRGLGYATLWKARGFYVRTDKDTNNNNTESNYLQAEKWNQQAIKIGEEIKDYRLVGDAYIMFWRMERTRGSLVKSHGYLEKAIYYLEKPVSYKLTGLLEISKCEQCQGSESLLGRLYLDYAKILGADIKDFTSVKDKIDKAVFYFSKNGNKWDLAIAYMHIGEIANQFINLETGIKYILKAVDLYREANNPNGEIQALVSLCAAYWNMGDFENGLNTARRSLTLAEKGIKYSNVGRMDSFRLSATYYWLGRFYEIAGDYSTSLTVFKKSHNFFPYIPPYIPLITAIGDLYIKTGNLDSAKVYLMQFETRQKGKLELANLYISLKQYDDALRILSAGTGIYYYWNSNLDLGRKFLLFSNAYFGKNNFEQALIHAKQGVNLLGQLKRNTYLIDGYKVLSDIFDKMGKPDSAFYYIKKYSLLKDSLLTRQFYFLLNDYKKEAEEAKRIGQINLLQKDNLIKQQELEQQTLLKEQSEAELSLLDKSNELKDQKIKEQTFLKEQNESQLTLLDKENKLKDQRLKQQAFIRNALLGGLLLFILLGVFVFRNLSLKRKNEKLAVKKGQAELQQKVSELEMQALRAQMNPHFIFNCLNSINRFIFKNETREASDYLTRFSRLIRMVLLHSQKKLVPLEDELEMLKLYLDMERLRFKNAFDYHITTTNAIENSSVFIPPLLLQPFCENAIWHGMMHKDGPGHLNIELNEDNGILNCIITDDGVGREKAEEFKSKSAEKEKSMGLKITKERLSLLNQGTTGGTFYKIEDVRNEQGDIAGTKVKLQIKYKETVEEMV